MLDEKYSRRPKVFKGELSEYRSWLFDLLMVVKQIDSNLAEAIKIVLRDRGLEGERWNHAGRVDGELWVKYHSELYAALSSLTRGVAKTALKGSYDRDKTMDWLKVLALFQARFNVKTVGSMLDACLEVVSPMAIKESELAAGFRKWEAAVAAMGSWYGEKPSNMMAAIFLGMIPKEYKSMAYRSPSMLKGGVLELRYEELRDFVLAVARQEANIPKEADSVEQGLE